MRALFLLLFVSVESFAQLAGLTTTDDGSVLMFRSNMRLQGSLDGDEDKIAQQKTINDSKLAPDILVQTC